MSEAVSVFKYTLEMQDYQTLQLPGGARLLDVQLQQGTLQLWALVEPQCAVTPRTFRILGTGHEQDGSERLQHIATVQQLSGTLVWHVFEVTA